MTCGSIRHSFFSFCGTLDALLSGRWVIILSNLPGFPLLFPLSSHFHTDCVWGVDFIGNNGESKVPFQAVSLKDLSSVESHSRHTPLSVELESNESCLQRVGSNYARPYDMFPVTVGPIDASTLRRAAAAAAAHDKSFQLTRVPGVYNFWKSPLSTFLGSPHFCTIIYSSHSGEHLQLFSRSCVTQHRAKFHAREKLPIGMMMMLSPTLHFVMHLYLMQEEAEIRHQ